MVGVGVRARRAAVGCVAALTIGGLAGVAGADWPAKPAGPGVANHPVGVVPSSRVSVPDDWPLAPDGSIDCLTCHVAIPQTNGTREPRLRGVVGQPDYPATFCARCHIGDGVGSDAFHWRALGTAHIGAGSSASRRYSGRLDGESRQCLSCHDGVTASESIGGSGSHGFAAFSDAGRNHPVGVDYPLSNLKRGASPYRSPALLPPQVRLPDGKVSCVSCHDLYAPDRLTVRIERSALCLTCHQMD